MLRPALDVQDPIYKRGSQIATEDVHTHTHRGVCERLFKSLQ